VGTWVWRRHKRRQQGAESISRFPQAIAIVAVLGVVFANLIADLLYAAVNPRIR